MEFEWSTSEVAKKTVTIYTSNFTLNTSACRHFENVQFVLLGIDHKNNLLGIKPVDKDALNKKLYKEDQLHKISIGKSYGRISNKPFIARLSEDYQLPIDDKQGIKMDAHYDVIHQILLVDLSKEGNH